MIGIYIGNAIGRKKASPYWTPQKYIEKNAIARHTPSTALGNLNPSADSGLLWPDMKNGGELLGAEQASGVTVVGKYYKITASTGWYFDVPSNVGDYWKCTAVKTLDATHKVKEVLGNFVYQQDNSKKPVNGVADGSNDFMKSPAIADLVQPIFGFIVARQVTWGEKFLFDGNADASGYIFQYSSTPQIKMGAGSQLTEINDWLVNKLALIRVVFNGASSKYQINNCPAMTGNAGTNNMGGITYFRYGGSNLGFGNYELKDAVWFAGAGVPDAKMEEKIFDYLRDEYFDYKKICTVGDSLTAEAAIKLNRYGVYDITDVSHAGDDIAAQQIVWNALTDSVKASFDYIFVMIGVNSLTHDPATVYAEYQTLINSINTKKKTGAKLVFSTIAPCLEHSDLETYKAFYLEINARIKGTSGTPFTGIDTVLDHDDMGDANYYLLAAYDNGDHLHFNVAGQEKIALSYSTAIT